MANHHLRIYSPAGVFLSDLRFKSIDVSLAERQITPMTIALFPEFPDAFFQRDCRIAYQRDEKLVGDTVWLLGRRERTFDVRTQQHTIVLTCRHPNAILGSRVVAYDEGTAEADKADIGSDNMYDYVDENFVTATDSARNISTEHFVLDPRPSPTFGASIDMAGSYRNVRDILEEIAQASAAQGAYVGYEVYVQQPPGPFRVRFYSKVRGTNRGLTTSQPTIIYPQFALGGNVSVHEDWSSAVTFAYAGGAGKDDERIVQSQSDATLIAQSPFGRVEHFESFNTDSTAILSSEAYKVLRDYRPRRGFVADGTPDPQQYSNAEYGVTYGWGDIIGAVFSAPYFLDGYFQGWIEYQFDVRVNPVHIQVVRSYDEGRNTIDTEETIEIHLQSVDSA